MTEFDYVARKRTELKLKKDNKGKEDNSFRIVNLLKLEAEDVNKSLPQVIREHHLENLFPHYFL